MVGVVALFSALFAFAVTARAETIETTDTDPIATTVAADPVATVPAASEPTPTPTSPSPEPAPTPAPAPTSAPEPVEAPEVGVATVSAVEAPDVAAVADSVGEAVDSSPAPPAPDPVSTPDLHVPASTPVPSSADPVSAVSDAIPAAPIEPNLPVHVGTDPGRTVAAVVTSATEQVHRVSQLAEGAVEGSTGTVASVVADIPRTAASVVADAPKAVVPIAPTVPIVESLDLPSALAPVFEGTTQLAGEALVAPTQVLPEAAAPETRPVSGTPPAPSESGGALPGLPADVPGGLAAKYMAGFGGAEPSSLGALVSLRNPKGSPSPELASGGTPSGAIRNFDGPAPLDNPGAPLPGSPGAAAGGSGASFFVPLAALLALLALVAPATLRRLREVPDVPAPTPFVCALERPG